jgi:hypothetical protein
MLIANNIHSLLQIIQEVDDIEGNFETIFETQCLCRPNDFKILKFQFHESYDSIQNFHDACDYSKNVRGCENSINKKLTTFYCSL